MTTLNFRPVAVTTLKFFHVFIFLSSDISRKQTRQCRKSTKEARSGNGYANGREKQTIVAKKQLVIMQAVTRAYCKNLLSVM